jgi:hypothetical protein
MLRQHLTKVGMAALVTAGCLTKPNPLHGVGDGATSTDVASTSVSASTTTSDSSATTTAATEPTGTSGTASTTSDTMGTESSDGGSTGGTSHEFLAAIAVCTHDEVHDPQACIEESDDALCVDQIDGDDGVECRTHLRFDLGDALDDRVVVEAALTMVVESSFAPQTGEVWRIECFDAADLGNGFPVPLDPAADDLGEVWGGQEVQWSIPASFFDGTPSSICFSVIPTSDDGVEYYGADGTDSDRPVLRVLTG